MLYALALVAPAEAAFPGKNGKIAFGGRDGIYSINPDGTGQLRLTTAPIGAFDSAPAWSADGTKLAFTRSDGKRSDIYVMNADGSGQRNLTNSPDVYEASPAWSPDGQSIAFSASGDLYRLNTDGTNLVNLTNTPHLEEFEPAWSPDGTRIAFVEQDVLDLYWGIYAMNADGSGDPARLTNGLDVSPNWSPDGSKIAYQAYLYAILSVNADGGGDALITNEPGQGEGHPYLIDWSPAWSPDGTKLAFMRTDARPEPDLVELATVNSEGSDRKIIANLGEFAGEPDWQPIPAPKRSDYKNAAKFCEADRTFLGDAAFAKKYGTNGKGSNAYGECVSQNI